MRLIRIEERELKHWDKRYIDKTELHIKEPSELELEKAIAHVNVNELDTLVIYK